MGRAIPRPVIFGFIFLIHTFKSIWPRPIKDKRKKSESAKSHSNRAGLQFPAGRIYLQEHL